MMIQIIYMYMYIEYTVKRYINVYSYKCLYIYRLYINSKEILSCMSNCGTNGTYFTEMFSNLLFVHHIYFFLQALHFMLKRSRGILSGIV